MKHHSYFKFYHNIKIKQCFNCFFYEHIKIQCFLHIIKCGRYADSDYNWKNCSMFKLKTKCISCGDAHSSVSENCIIRRKKMKKQRKTTVLLFFYYFTPSFSSGLNSVFCSFKNRSLIVSKPQSSVSNVIKKENTTNHLISTSTVFLC